MQTERGEVCTHNRGQDSPMETDLARLIRCLGKEENFNSFNVTGLYQVTFCLRAAMSLT